MVLVIRMASAAITMVIWSAWAIPSVEVAVSKTLQIGIVQVVAKMNLFLEIWIILGDDLKCVYKYVLYYSRFTPVFVSASLL